MSLRREIDSLIRSYEKALEFTGFTPVTRREIKRSIKRLKKDKLRVQKGEMQWDGTPLSQQ